MERNAYFDNAKAILIYLVVFGHLIQPFVAESHEMNTLYLWIYTFHMPAFIFLAGFFAKGSGNLKYITRLAKKLLVPYIIFQVLYSIFYFIIGKEAWQTGVFYPHWSLWFLFSLFSWHILLIFFKKIPPTIGVISTILLGLAVGYIGEIGHTFSLSRTIVFFPFFLLGYWLTKEHVFWLKQKVVKVGSALVLLVIAVAIYIAPEFNSGWLLASKSYGELGATEYGGIARFLVYLTSTVMAISVMAWVPIERTRFTSVGSRTLYVYLLHGFFIQFFRENGLFEVNHVVDVIGLGVLSLGIVWILSSKLIIQTWQPFVEANLSIIRGAYGNKHSKHQN
ncbi:acyltransferase family protein [Oceanobacillus halotolerans]|uniref:acyltransferase family protein n=1 Tax=Oceanobacillus halotolerans TaxID=2663380 RepID=UPI0013DC9364|nr:acyltransferase family protein [Oceanobacillus halotolerans]